MIVEKIKEHKDGSATCTVTLTTEEERLFRDIAKTRKKRFSVKFMQTVILEALEEAVKEGKKK